MRGLAAWLVSRRSLPTGLRLCGHVVYLLELPQGVSFFFQAEDGIRHLVRSRGLGDVYKRQEQVHRRERVGFDVAAHALAGAIGREREAVSYTPLTLPPSDLG